MNAFITYDINFGHTEVKDSMRVKGYYSAWVSNNVTYYLPNTSLWKNGIELAAARQDLENSIRELNLTSQFSVNKITLIRCIVVAAFPWDGIPGTPH